MALGFCITRKTGLKLHGFCSMNFCECELFVCDPQCNICFQIDKINKKRKSFWIFACYVARSNFFSICVF